MAELAEAMSDMSNQYEAWFVDLSPAEKLLEDCPITAATEKDAIGEAEAWADGVCQVQGESKLYLKCAGETESFHGKIFRPLRP